MNTSDKTNTPTHPAVSCIFCGFMRKFSSMESQELRGQIIHTIRTQGPISGERLASTLGFSRVALWKHIEALRSMGYPIEGGRAGYELTESVDLPYPWEFPGLEDRIHYIPVCDSTMDEAESLARTPVLEGGAVDGTLVLAGIQQKGRGRLGRLWESPTGGIYGTLIVRPNQLPLQEFWTLQWQLIIAVVRSVRNLGVDASIKWPNDLLVGSKKVTGIIAETRSSGGLVEWGLLGFGINCNNPVPLVGVSLQELLGAPVDRIGLIQDILKEFSWSRELSREELTNQWKAYTSTIGRRVSIDMGQGRLIQGVAKDVFSDGSLLVVEDSGREQRCYSGDCLY